MATEVKPRSNRLLMILGIVVAAVAFVLVVFFGGGSKSGGGGVDRTIVVVTAAVDIPAGTQISQQLLATAKYAPDQLPTGTFSVLVCDPKLKTAGTCTDAIGQFADVAIPAKSALTASELVATVGAVQAQKKPYLDIPAGQVAISIPAGGEMQTAGGFIQPGDKVDIIFESAEVAPQKDKITFQNLVIQRVGPVTQTSTQGLSSSYIIYVTPQDAETMMYMFGHGTWKYALQSQLDAGKNGNVSTPGADKTSLVSKFQL